MSRFAEPMARLIEELKKLPGVGSKTAQRFAFHILRASDEDAELLAGRHPRGEGQPSPVLGLQQHHRRRSLHLLHQRHAQSAAGVRGRRATNIAAIEKTRHYNGVYHVLHGALSPLHGVGPDQLRISNLARRVESGSVDELILATNPTIEGEATATYLSRLFKSSAVKVTRIATGVPVGSDIEYADEVTMQKAMEGRREL